MGTVVGKEPCPKCREKGGDRSGDNLVRYSDGSSFCFKCNQPGYKGGEGTRKTSKLTVDQIKSLPIGSDSKRNISAEVSELLGIRAAYHPETGEVSRVYYPYHDKSGNITGYKGRELSSKSFLISGKLNGMFNQPSTPSGNSLFITEGEEDCMALVQIMKDREKNPDVVSLPNGVSAELDKPVRSELEFFSNYKRVYLCLDSDEVGKTYASLMADWLASVTDVYVVDSSPLKDISDYHTRGKGQDLYDKIIATTVYEPDGVVSGMDINIDDLLKPLEEGTPIPFPGLQDKLHGLRRAEIVTLCAGSGIGKSTLSRELAYSLVSQGKKVAMVALEDQMDVTAQAMVALDMNIPLNKFRFNPPAKAAAQPHFDKMIHSGNLFFWKHFGRMNLANLMDKLYYYARSKSCDFIVLDHLSSVVAASKENNERQAIDHIMDELSQLVIETGVGLIMVVHLKRPSGDKSFAKGGEVELSDLRGSAALEQYSWAVVGLERDQQGEDADFSRIRVLKNRTFGFTGLADTLRYDVDTGRMLPFTLDPGPDPDDTTLEEAT